MRGHVDAEALAMYREGLLRRNRTARIRAHLSGCPRCAAIDAGLAGLPALFTLASAPPMPTEVVSQIGAALAAEAAARPAAGAEPARAAEPAVPAVLPVPSPRPTGRIPQGRPGLRRKVLAFAAATAVVVAAGGYLLTRLLPASESAGSNAAAPAAGATSRAGQPNAAAGSSALPVISSGTDYRSGQLAAQVTAVLAKYAVSGSGTHLSMPSGPTAVSRAPQSADAAAVAACVARIAAGQRPRLVDEARYNGHFATIIVLSASAQGPAQVWVVGSACSGSQRDVIARTQLPGPG